ncbi:MAG: hypothetical protein R2991_11195, partial [Thermoanaerobaculia bacterium]
ERATDLVELAGRTGKPDDALAAASARGITSFYAGAHAEAMEHLETAGRGFEPGSHYDRVARFADDPCFGALVTWGWALALAGREEEGLAAVRRAVEAAEALSNPVELARGLAHLSVTLFSAGRADAELAAAVGRCLEISSAEGFPVWIGYGRMWAGWMAAREGEAGGPVEMREGIGLLRMLGLGSGSALCSGVLADASLALGDVAAGLAAVEEGLAAVESTGERLWEPELLRLQGELRALDEPASREAGALLERSRLLARERGSRQFELRAAVGLGRLRRDGEEREAARVALEETLGGFPDDATGAPVLEARSLLGELGG